MTNSAPILDTIRFIECSDIFIPPNRQRRDFDEAKIRELRLSILSKGLLHPIVLRNDSRTLLAGERRLIAIRELMKPFTFQGQEVPLGFIPCTLARELSPTELEEAELEENTVRVDLTWQERDAAVARLHKLRTTQALERGETQTKSQTLFELLGHKGSSGQATEVVSNALLVEEHLDDPQVAKAKSRKEALNVIKRKLSAEHNAKVAAEISSIDSPHFCFNGNCVDILKGDLGRGLFDCVLADPPYGIGANKFKAMSGSESGQSHSYEDSLEDALPIWRAILHDTYHIHTKAQAHLYMFCDIRYWMHLSDEAKAVGWAPWPRPLIWHKPSGGMLGDSQHGPRMSYETILFANKGRKKVKGVYLDVIINNAADASLHAAAKPVNLLVNLLRRSVSAGDRVLDPCCGSGSIFPAATALSVLATGIEINEHHYNTSLARLGETIDVQT